MSYTKVIIHDYHSIIQLNDAIDYCGDTLLKLLKEVDIYFKNCIKVLEEQRDILKQQLLIAEKQLQDEESEYSNCIESQREYTDDDGCICQSSCNSEQSKVESARQYVASVKENQKKQSLYCLIAIMKQQSINLILLAPPGGEKLQNFTKYHTDEAQLKLNKILEVVEKYLGRPLRQTIPNESLPSAKVQQFVKATEKVKAKQQSESANVVDANVSMVCNRCHVNSNLCVRQNKRQSQIIIKR